MFKAPSFLVKRTFIQATRSSGRIQWRNASTNAGKRSLSRSRLAIVSGGALLALGLSPFYMSRIHADSTLQLQAGSRTGESEEVSLGALVRSYVVYTMCSIPALVDYSPQLLQLTNIPGLRWVTEALVRITFFDQVGSSLR